MVLGKKVQQITKEFLFSKIDSFDIYKREIPNLQIGSAISSPLREDKNPSFLVKVCSTDNQLRHYDFAREELHGDAVDFICQKYALNYDKALQYIAKEFGLLDGSNSYKEIQQQYSKPVLDAKRNCLIQVTVKKWNAKELAYWGSYGITQEDLKREEIYPLAEYWINRVKQKVDKGELAFCYRYSSLYKLYFPDRSKESGERWKSNIPTSLVEKEERIEGATKVFITKAKKDRMLFENILQGFAIINVQNETRSAFKPELIEKLKGKEVWLNFDADAPGKENSMKLTQEYGFKHFNVPNKFLPEYKDFSDVVREFGDKPLIKHLKAKKLIV